MKKGMSKLLSALLIATLVFTSAGVAFAGTEGSEANEGMRVVGEEAAVLQTADKALADGTKNKDVTQKLKGTAINKKASANFPLTTLKTGDEKIAGYNVYAVDQVFTVKAPSKGTVSFDVRCKGTLTDGTVYLHMYSDAALTKSLGIVSLTPSTSGLKTLVAKAPAAGTYYLSIEPYRAAGYVSVWGSFVNGSDRTMANKTWSAVGLKDAQTNYLKFKAANSGYVTVLHQGLSGKVTLTNSKKKTLSNAVYASSYNNTSKITFGVKKGTTYYLKVASNYNSDGAYRVKYTNSKIADKSGSKKSKAKTMKRKATYKGSIIAGSSTSDWYKFKVTSKRKVTVTMKGATNNKIKAVFYTSKGKKIGSTTFYDYNSKRVLQSVGKLSKGTYYVKVYRGTTTSSGWYSLNWK